MTKSKKMSIFVAVVFLNIGTLLVATQVYAVTSIPLSIIRANESGDHVRTLQEGLSNAGYYAYPISGYYDPRTTKSVRAFQQANSLSADGTAGPNTITALNTLNRVPTNITTVSPVALTTIAPRPSSTSSHRHLINQRIVMGEILANGSNSRPSGIASCNSNEVVLGGGYNIEINTDFDVLSSYPNTRSSWKVIIDPGIGSDELAGLASDQTTTTATALNTLLQNGGSKVYAICAEEEELSSHF